MTGTMQHADLAVPEAAPPRVLVRGQPLAVIDLGSNTARLVIFRSSAEGSVRAIDERKEVPRMGLGLAPDGRLDPGAMARGTASLQRFARIVRDLGVEQIVAVATSAVRDAPNGPEFLAAVQRAAGVTIRVVSGIEEARYAYLGVASAWELDTAFVCDLGGGSLQLAEVRHGRLTNSVSLPLGALRLTQQFLPHDPPKGNELDQLRDSVRDTVRGTARAFGGEGYRLYGVGGTLRALARATIDLRDYPIARVHGFVLRSHDLEALYELLSTMPASKRRALPGIGGDRVDVIVAGIVVFEELLRATGSREITVSGTGIREGIALESLGSELPVSAERLAHRSVAAAAEGLSFSLEHGERVAAVARALFEAIADRLGWGSAELRALLVAAWMHDAGVAIDLWRHARHSAYLLRNMPIGGLESREVILASMAAYLHEGDSPRSSWRKELAPILRPGDLERALGLGAVLQVAELLHPAAPRFSLGSGGKALSVELGEAEAAALHPRALEKARKPLEKVLSFEVRIHDG